MPALLHVQITAPHGDLSSHFAFFFFFFFFFFFSVDLARCLVAS
jgi:hypothetical protein